MLGSRGAAVVVLQTYQPVERFIRGCPLPTSSIFLVSCSEVLRGFLRDNYLDDQHNVVGFCGAVVVVL
jgi:hypothetical protein